MLKPDLEQVGVLDTYTPWSRKKTAQSFVRHNFWAICCRMALFAPKCSAEFTVYQSMQNWCDCYKYSLLNSRKLWHVIGDVTCVKTWHLWLLRIVSCRQMTLTSLSRQTGQQTHLIWIWWIIPFGALFSSWYIVTRLRTLIIWNKSWTDAGVCSAKN